MTEEVRIMSKMKNNYKDRKAQTININECYAALKHHIHERVGWQQAQDNLWSFIKRTHSNQSSEMARIDEKIGYYTHMINGVIGKLCQYHHAHRAMNLAMQYLDNEIERIERIIYSKGKLVREVEYGYTHLINVKGYRHSDTSNLRRYLEKKEGQLARLQKWKSHIARYMV